MPITRVQAAPKATCADTQLTITFSTPPTIGNGIVVAGVVFDPNVISLTCSDNRGNTYTLVRQQYGGNRASAHLFYCGAIAATGAPFTITLPGSFGYYGLGTALEVTGGIVLDQTTGSGSATAAPATGATATLTAAEVFEVALVAMDGDVATCVVESVSPAWTQEVEDLTWNFGVGEVDSRARTGALGATSSCSWTLAISRSNARAVAAFTSTAPAAPPARVSQLPVEVVATTPTTTRVTQAPVEVVAVVPARARVSQAIVELLSPAGPGLVPPTQNPGWLAWVEWPADAEELARRRDRQRQARTPRSGPPWPVVAYSDWDLQDPPAYYHGLKEARVERFGEATRTLSEPRSGDWQGSAFDIRLSDFDRTLRTKLASPTDRYWTVGNYILRMVTRQTRAALEDALTVFVGPLRRADPVPPLSVELLLEDAVGHGMLADEHRIPQRVVDASDWTAIPNMAEAAKGHPVPIIYGTHVRANGAFAPIYLGVEGANHVWLVAGHYARVLDVLLDGIGVTGQDPADWTLPGLSGPAYEEVAGKRYTLLRGRKGTPPSVTDPVLYSENAGEGTASIESWMGGVLAADFFWPDPGSRWDVSSTLDPRTGTRHIQGSGLLADDTAAGYFRLAGDPEPPAATAYFIADYTSLVLYLKNGTLGWGDAELQLRFAISGEDVVVLGVSVPLSDGLYGLNTFDTTTWQTITIPVEDFEIDETLPVNRLYITKAGDDPLDVAIDDISFVGGAEVEAIVTPADEAASGLKTLTVNVSGWTTTGDETGLVWAAIADQYAHFLIHYVAHPEGYQTGGPLPNPTSDLFDRTVDAVKASSFDVAKAQGLRRYPPNGYLGHAILGATPADRLPVRTWLQRWNLSADCRFGVTRYGELVIVMHDPTDDDQAAAPVVTEVLDVLEGSFAIDVQWTSHATRIPFRAGFNYATGEWTVFRDAEDTALSEAYGRPEGIPGAVREYWFISDSDQAKNVAEHEVARVGHPPRVLQFETALGDLVTRELGDYVTVRHFAGVGPDAERLCQIEALTIAPGTRRLRLQALDVTDLITATGGPPEVSSARIGIARIGVMRIGFPGLPTGASHGN